jgi:hypothetical protein
VETMMRELKVELSIDERVLREHTFEVLKRNGFTDDRANELSFQIAKEVRRVASVTTYFASENVNPPEGGPYR